MKTKEILKLIFVNPFEKIAGWQALGLGLIALVITAFIGSYNGAVFDAALSMHMSFESYPIWIAFAMLAINLTSIVLMYLIAGVVFSKNFRVIDVVGTVALAKVPNIFLALLAFIPLPILQAAQTDRTIFMEDPFLLLGSFSFIAFILCSLILMVWYITLLYNAFKVSLNINRNLRIVVFIFALILAIIISMMVVHRLF